MYHGAPTAQPRPPNTANNQLHPIAHWISSRILPTRTCSGARPYASIARIRVLTRLVASLVSHVPFQRQLFARVLSLAKVAIVQPPFNNSQPCSAARTSSHVCLNVSCGRSNLLAATRSQNPLDVCRGEKRPSVTAMRSDWANLGSGRGQGNDF